MNSLTRTQPMEVDIEMSDPMPNDEQSEADLQSLLDLTKVSATDVKKLRAVGLKVKRQGILETQRGTIYVTQAWLMGATAELYRLLKQKTKPKDDKPAEPDIDEICKLADTLSKLAGKQAELSVAMSAHEPKEVGGELPKPLNTPFPAGAAVLIGGNAQAHFHQNAPEKAVATPPPQA